jgi:hypothetical protein
MGATKRGGRVLGFAIAFIALAFGGELGLPLSVRLILTGVGVLLVVLSAEMTRFGLKALVAAGFVLVSSMTLLEDPSAPRLRPGWYPRVPRTDDTTGPQADGEYILTRQDKRFIEDAWRRRTEAEQHAICALIRDGISDTQLQDALSAMQQLPPELREGVPTEETDGLAYVRAGFAYTETELC